MSIIKKLAGETLIYGMASIFPRMLNILMTLVYLTYRFNDTEDYGSYNEMYAYVTIFLTILVYRLDTAYFRYGSRPENKDNVFSTALIPVIVSAIVIVGVVLVYSQSIATWLSYEDKPHYIQWFALIIGFDAVATLFYGKFRLASQTKRFLFFRLANVVLTIIFILIFLEVLPRIAPEIGQNIASFFGVTKELDFVFLANLLASGSILLLLIPEFVRVKWSLDFGLLKKMLLYSFPLIVVGLAGNINQAFAVPLQKYFLGADTAANLSDAGLYAAAAKIALLLNLFTVAFNYAAEPFFFNNAKEKKAYGQVALAFTIVCVIVIIGIITFSGLAQYLVGSQYRASLNIVPWLLFAYFFLGLYYNVAIWFKLSDRTMVGAIISVFGAIITLVVSIYFLPRVGTIASAYAAVTTYAFMIVAGYLTGQKYYPIQYPIKKILTYVVVAVIMTVSLVLLRSQVNTFVSMALGIVYNIGLLGYVWKYERKELLS
ncbi:MAG: polysaccharide biosynthesis C-terminal domain-containing protein [Saprospiraceae bacterium]